jgi:hypothetical protein
MKTAPISAPLDLNKMPRLKELFSLLNGGRHINRLADPVLWAELEREAIQYEALFAALGYELRIDGRGYAWFQSAEASATVSKATRQLALLFMLLFELQADAGQHLGRFTDWHIDRKLLAALWDKNQALLEAEGFADAEPLSQLLDAAARYGFAEALPNGWRLLPAVFRYLDRFEELSGDSHPAHAASVELAIAEREDA